MSVTGQSSKSKGSGRSESFDLIPPEFQALRGPLASFFQQSLPQLQSFLGEGFQNTPEGLNNFRSGLTGGEFQGIQQLQDQARGLSENEQLGQDLIGQRLRGDFLDPSKNDALRNVVRFTTANINDEFNDQDLERKSLFARAGQRLPESSPFAQAQATGNQGRARAIGESTSNILFGGLEAERGRQTQAVEQARANSQGIFQRSQAALQAAALPRLVDDLGIERGLQEFQSRLAALSSALGVAGNVASPTVGQRGSNRNSSKSGGGGVSSIQFKENVANLPDQTRELMKLLPVTFDYRPDVAIEDDHHDRSRIGLVAEEVEPFFPEVIWKEGNRTKGIFYQELVPVLISAVQSLVRRVDELEGRA